MCLAAACVENAVANSNNIIFTIKDTKLYVTVVTISAKDNLTKAFERSVYWKKYKKSENKNITDEFRYFLKSNFGGVNRLFVLVYSNEDNNSKRYIARRYYLPKDIVKNYNDTGVHLGFSEGRGPNFRKRQTNIKR